MSSTEVGGRSGLADIEAMAAVVRRTRKSWGLTQVQLAGLAGVGPRFIVELESGKPTVALNKVVQVLAALGLRLQAELGA